MIHTSSIIDPTAIIAKNVEIGPFCLILIGEGSKIESHGFERSMKLEREIMYFNFLHFRCSTRNTRMSLQL